ncbi:NMT1/THI5 like [Pseudarthrobacter enclensis]|uniref:SsuA/THI5-like domain-containing protein n=1 Tax=Pseudarthrobacter enclensis TaxID=993070 RepID=A0A0V8I6N7_9MICC|nr:ABC transporter substrate-binding protein [Pseudarthrobacter enclensis]KSU70017.1 hypothetical protein AS031_18355 [Pseudarthrobacter enclensis]SCC30281.1 NMT1/THI5 like [Pseudarthrobacter enclensis]
MKLRQNQFIPVVPVVAAMEAGLLNEIDLDITVTKGSADQLQALLAKETDLAVTAIDNLFEWTRSGADLRLIAQVERTAPLGIYAHAEFASLKDLTGRTFSVDAIANGFSLVARHLLTSAGVRVEYVEQGGARERLQALLSGEADATILAPPFDTMAENAGKRLLATVTDLMPTFPGQGLVVRADRVQSEPLTRYLRALHEAVALTESMADQAGIDMLKRHGVERGANAMWATRPRTLRVDPEGLRAITNIRESLGMLPPDVNLSALHDPAPLNIATGIER